MSTEAQRFQFRDIRSLAGVTPRDIRRGAVTADGALRIATGAALASINRGESTGAAASIVSVEWEDSLCRRVRIQYVASPRMLGDSRFFEMGFPVECAAS